MTTLTLPAVEQSAIRGLVVDVLENWSRREWTLQGLGMLRTYVGPSHRLHVWDPRFAVEDVTDMHTHPWDMRSYVVSGEVRQHRYARHPFQGEREEWTEQAITCGAGGGVCGGPVQVFLAREPVEVYGPGESYSQTYNEIHSTSPEPGTVTLIERTVPEDGDPDTAYVYYRGEWVSAEPRKAEVMEVNEIVNSALELMA